MIPFYHIDFMAYSCYSNHSAHLPVCQVKSLFFLSFREYAEIYAYCSMVFVVFVSVDAQTAQNSHSQRTELSVCSLSVEVRKQISFVDEHLATLTVSGSHVWELTLGDELADSVAGLHTKKVFVVAAVYHTIIPFLPSIISLSGFSKKLLVCFTDRLTHKGDVLRSAERINIVRHELPVIVSQRTLSLTE